MFALACGLNAHMNNKCALSSVRKMGLWCKGSINKQAEPDNPSRVNEGKSKERHKDVPKEPLLSPLESATHCEVAIALNQCFHQNSIMSAPIERVI